MWINIITQDNTGPCSVMSSPTPSPTPSSPWSRYLYSPTNRYLPLSSPPPYTEYDYAHSLSSGGSRSPSQLSEHKSNPNTTSIPFPSTPRTTNNSSMLYKPDLIQMSSPRHWIRQSNEERSRHLYSESVGCDMSAMSDKWDSLEIIEHKNDDLSANEELGENTQQSETSIDRSLETGEQGSKFDSKNLSKFKPSKEKYETTERIYRKNDKDVINSVNKMDADLQVNTKVMKTEQRKKEKNMKKVKFVNDDENEYENQFDSILSMIQQAVEDLNV